MLNFFLSDDSTFISLICNLLSIYILEKNRLISSNLFTKGLVIINLRGPRLRSQLSIPASPPLRLVCYGIKWMWQAFKVKGKSIIKILTSTWKHSLVKSFTYKTKKLEKRREGVSMGTKIHILYFNLLRRVALRQKPFFKRPSIKNLHTIYS